MLRLFGALIGLRLIWGLSFVFMKWLLPPAGVWRIVFLRCLAGAIILLQVLLWRRREIKGRLPWKALIVQNKLHYLFRNLYYAISLIIFYNSYFIKAPDLLKHHLQYVIGFVNTLGPNFSVLELESLT